MQAPAAPMLVFDAAAPRRRERALEDLVQGFRRWRLAWALARGDITHRYRGSVLGPFWLTLSTAIMLGALGLLYARLFQMDLASYLPWLAVSLILWQMIAQVIADACTCLTSAESVIRQLPLPYSLHALRSVMRNAIVAAHNLPLILVVFLIFGFSPGWGALLLLPGLALVLVNAFLVSLLLGMLCARFRDIPPIVGSITQLAFFMSPVLWKPALVGHWQPLLPVNPFFAVMETVRAPLVAEGGGVVVWLAALGYTLLLAALAGAMFTRYRGRIAFWV